MKKLFNKMEELAQKQFKKHDCNYILSDLQIDFETLQKTEGKIFIWLIRDMGTQLWDMEELKVKKSHDNVQSDYFLNNWKDSFKIYKIDIKKQQVKQIKKETLENIIKYATHNEIKTIVRVKNDLGMIESKTFEYNTAYVQKAIEYVKWKTKEYYGIPEDKIIQIQTI